MGRNAIPKIGEWRDGALYDFRTAHNTNFSLTNGGQIVFTRADQSGEEILACCFADGAAECLVSFFQSGFEKGIREGERRTKAAIRAALGIEL